MIDAEHKITEFDFENYVDKQLLPQGQAAQSPEFKRLVHVLNLFSQTEHEKLQSDKEAFKELMPVLRSLNCCEQKALLHKIANSRNDSLLNEMAY